MDLVECYCGIKIDCNSGPSHLLECSKWRRRSKLFSLAKALYIENEGPTLLRMECEALMMFEFSSEVSGDPVKPQKHKKKSQRPAPITADEEEETRQLIERLKWEDSHRNEDTISCVVCNCRKSDMSELSFLNCNHILCSEHVRHEIMSSYRTTGNAKCPAGCGYILSYEELLSIVTQEELDELQPAIDAREAIEGTDGMLASCPCGLKIWLEPGKVDLSYKDEAGNPISRAHAEHMAKYRLRCNCGKISCSKCHAEPYHIGKTCDEFQTFKNAKHCRYCGDAIKGNLTICAQEECKDRFARSCKKKLNCGHRCFGTCDETQCMECLDEECEGRGNDYCIICYTEGIGSAPSVKLRCGHIFHFHCLSTTINKRWNGPRITFNFAKCPSCQAWVNTPFHDEITQRLAQVFALYEDIKDKALKRLKFEGMDGEERLKNPTDPYYNNPEKYSLDRFSYYMCFKCKLPYFGGKKECGENNDQAKYNPEELVCPSCAAIGVEGADCKTHGKDFIEFKCKFCCSVAAWFCWGTTHFCDACHTKQNNGDYLSKKAKGDLPVCLGKACPLKVAHPANGEEFALGCTLCRNLVANNRDF